MGAPRVLIVGTSTRAFAESASRAGHACVSVDAFGDLDQKARVENVGLGRDLGRAYSAAAAVAVSRRCDAERVAYVGNLENHPSAVRRLAAGRVLLGNPPATLTRARDHAALARVVEAAGARVPRTLRADAARSSPLAGAWLKKPAASRPGRQAHA
jgi:predicted ATP-grasp superfamily ATP-dependent carboligase